MVEGSDEVNVGFGLDYLGRLEWSAKIEGQDKTPFLYSFSSGNLARLPLTTWLRELVLVKL